MGDCVQLLYKVALSQDALEQGELIECNTDPETPGQFKVDKGVLLEGVFQALIGMRSGGSIRRAIIPPELAFGSRSWAGIPENSTLYVELCLAYITKPAIGGRDV